ncbi:MAG: universal stress protein [Vicinamibacteraceae bacterium]|nr:universal stress protein [Vicinamibacteraceae bacterium]
MLNLKTILVATDFSDASQAALDYARGLAERFDASLHVLHVLEDLAAHAWTTEVYVAALPGVHEEMERQAQERLGALFSDEERERFRVRTALRLGSPFVEIIRYARDEHADLIVMGTHGRGAIAHMLLGSVAERVVRKAACPVLTVRHASHDFELP